METGGRRPVVVRQDTFDLREHLIPSTDTNDDDEHNEYDVMAQVHTDAAHTAGNATTTTHTDADVEPRSVLDDDSDGEGEGEDFIDDDDDDRSSSLSIPNESIDFDLVYSLHSFAATVEGQANVVKGDRLVLIDDSNSYWWLVRVLKTQEVGYIPAENIETPFERLARLNKHRNVDLASATQAEMQGELNASQDRLRQRTAGGQTPSPIPGRGRSQSQSTGRRLVFTSNMSVHRYAPAIWDEEDEDLDDDEDYDQVEYMATDPDLADDERERAERMRGEHYSPHSSGRMEVDDEMMWDEYDAQTPEPATAAAAAEVQPQAPPSPQQQQQPPLTQQPSKELKSPPSTEQLLSPPDVLRPGLASPSVAGFDGRQLVDPADATAETVRKTITPSVARGDVDTTYISPSSPPQQQLSQRQEDERAKRVRERLEEEEEALRNTKRSRSGSGSTATTTASTTTSISQVKSSSPAPSSSQQQGSGQKLTKQRKPDTQSQSEDEGSSSGGKKKKGGLWSGLFPRKKDKDKNKEKEKEREKERGVSGGGGEMKNASVTSFDSSDTRVSEESRVSRPSTTTSHDHHHPPTGTNVSPTTGLAMQQQQLAQQRVGGAGATGGGVLVGDGGVGGDPKTQGRDGASLSQHASQLRQHDQQQQALYKNYLMSSPSSPPEVSYGLQSASTVLGNAYMPPSSASNNSNSAPGTPSGTGLGLPTTPRPRPGSLILTTTSSGSIVVDGAGAMGLPAAVSHQELSVIRIFAGQGLAQLTDATFKTALLNSSTVASDLIKQAIQRFRLPTSSPHHIQEGEGDDADDNDDNNNAFSYYLTVKQVHSDTPLVLSPSDHPLQIFEHLVAEATALSEMENNMMMAMMVPKVKRSSMGSIDSVASNLSMHPAIRKLPMNDFTDDSQVKFYLNRRVGSMRGGEDIGGGVMLHWGEASLGGEFTAEPGMIGETMVQSPKNQYLTVSTAGERYPSTGGASSPSVRFAVQLIIQKEDLPENMMFHPTTEAIVFKEDHHHQSSGTPSIQVSSSSSSQHHPNPNMRRKVFMFPKMVTVAEVIELGLERFGILEGVVDGGDEVEDKLVVVGSRRRSSMGSGSGSGGRVRYGLWIGVDGQERELTPSSKLTDAYPAGRPPTFKSPSAGQDANSSLLTGGNTLIKRRSIDATQLLGTVEDVHPDDPVFLLRRATSYRPTTGGGGGGVGGGFVTRHGRHSAPLDEIALQKMNSMISSREREGRGEHRQSGVSVESALSYASLDKSRQLTLEEQDNTLEQTPPRSQIEKQRSAQEIIAAQRAQTRANQIASILSAQSNSVRGTDIVLPDNAVLRSSRYEETGGMRYSYVEPDGETTYDVSDIVEAEWGSEYQQQQQQYQQQYQQQQHQRRRAEEGDVDGDDGDLLKVVGAQQGLGANLDRVLNRIRNGKVSLGRDEGVVSSAALSLTVEGVSDVDEDTTTIGATPKQQQRVHNEDDEDDSANDTIVVDGLGALSGGARRDRESKESGVSVPSVSEYSVEDSLTRSSRSGTPGSAGFVSQMPSASGANAGAGLAAAASAFAASAGVTHGHSHSHSRSISSLDYRSSEERAERSSPILPRASTSTPTTAATAAMGRPAVMERRQPSLASVLSDGTTTAGYVTPPLHPIAPQVFESPRSFSSSIATPKGGSGKSSSLGGSHQNQYRRRGPVIPKDDFGISHMMAIIEYQTAQAKSQEVGATAGERGEKGKVEERDVVDERLFGRPVDLEKLHPQVREIYEDGFRMLEEMDKVLDGYVQPSIGAF
ncbi:hypothetical protein D9756_001108 [Leucocoprinus leucothites]|uniref:SH3 domain-containing protein n=1 Tax=Leucocoprinus leucothites TaxID=201217 RepID=A0A8H5GFB2_9AGAR|nr:hypothetical protein D9756_001108 [Leucoagaricus leucothites]